MTAAETRALLTIALFAAFADGDKDDAERAEIKRIAASLPAAGVDFAALYQDVLLKRVSVGDVVGALTTPETRRLAYELAVCVADADGAQNDREQAFLGGLRAALELDDRDAADFTAQAEAVATAPLEKSTGVEPRYAATMDRAEMDRMILNYAILNGALELLPDSLAAMAIIPLQMKMVYRVGKAHGFELDRGHIRDFLATLGVGLTAQYVEQLGAKLVGGLLGKLGGGLLRGLGRQAVSSGLSFATTYALGQIARRYYAGGRTLTGDALKEAFSEMLGEARGLQSRFLPDIESRARTIDVKQVISELGQ